MNEKFSKEELEMLNKYKSFTENTMKRTVNKIVFACSKIWFNAEERIARSYLSLEKQMLFDIEEIKKLYVEGDFSDEYVDEMIKIYSSIWNSQARRIADAVKERFNKDLLGELTMNERIRKKLGEW